jgi:hypothetical protein
MPYQPACRFLARGSSAGLDRLTAAGSARADVRSEYRERHNTRRPRRPSCLHRPPTVKTLRLHAFAPRVASQRKAAILRRHMRRHRTTRKVNTGAEETEWRF